MSKQCNSKSDKASNPDYICNPQSGQWVKKSGAVGKKLQAMGLKASTNISKPLSPVAQVQSSDEQLTNACLGKSKGKGGMNVGEMYDLAKARGYNGPKTRGDVTKFLCNPQSPVASPKPLAKKASSPKPLAKKASPKPAVPNASGCIQFTESNTTASQWKKYSTRASPPFPANECPEGMIQKGNDGNDYTVSAPNAKGVKRWVKMTAKLAAPSSVKPKAKLKAKPVPIPAKSVPSPTKPALGLTEKLLYKQDSKGKMRQWKGWIEQGQGNSYLMYVETGLLDGNKTTTRPKIYSQGKQGRGPKEQALFELESKISKKRDEGYFDTVKKAQATLVVLPMLALDFKKRGHDVSYPAIGQRKFDGVRCMASLNPDGTVSLKSRKGKEFPHMTHLRQQIATLKGIPSGAFLDGEMYSDTLTFQEVVGLVRRETLKPGDEDKLKQISYRLYDMCDLYYLMVGFQKRYDNLKKILGRNPPPNLILTENVELNNKTDIKKYHDQFVKEGYEGIMVRNKDGEYGINKRSKHLQKFKEFFDHEFEIVGFEEGTGNDAGTVIWVCKTETGGVFKARPLGTRAERTKYFNNGRDYIGSLLTVRYFELTDEGIPRFPVGVTIRNYE